MNKVSVLFVFSCCLAILASAQPSKTGILRYNILPANTSNKAAKIADLLEVNYRMSVASTDSLLTETFSTNQPVHIPVKHPSFKEIFLKVKPEDRLEIVISADSFYKHTMGQPLPAYLNQGDSLLFYMKVYDVMSAADLMNKQSKADREAISQDSAAMASFLKVYPEVIQTKSGVYLIKVREGNGRQPSVADSVLIKYKAYLFTGKVVDKSKEPGYQFMIGTKSVIPGLEEGIRYLKEGSRYKLVIPYLLAYGPDGNGDVPPFTSLVFDLELLKVK